MYVFTATIISALSINHAVVIEAIKLGKWQTFYSLLNFNNGFRTKFND